MSRHSTLISLFTDIADALRDKFNLSGLLLVDDFDTTIAAIPEYEGTIYIYPKLTIPTCSDKDYTGSTVTTAITGFDSETMTKSGQESGTDIGEYTVTFGLKYPDDYKWIDGSNTNKNVIWNIKNAPKLQVGGRIFYDDGDNGATYTFYDASGNIITDTSISGLANAVSYTISGTPTKDRWYVYDNTTHTTGGISVNNGLTNNLYWDVGQLGEIGMQEDGIGKGKTNTAKALMFTSDWQDTDIWNYIKNCNNDNLNGHNDWFILSKAEHDKLKESRLVGWYSIMCLWSSVESSEGFSYRWYCYDMCWESEYKIFMNQCFAARAF